MVPKRNGKMKPVINLRSLRRYLRKQPTSKWIHFSKGLNLIKSKDWTIFLDLSDAYLQVPIFKKIQTISKISHSMENTLFRAHSCTHSFREITLDRLSIMWISKTWSFQLFKNYCYKLHHFLILLITNIVKIGHRLLQTNILRKTNVVLCEIYWGNWNRTYTFVHSL